MNPKRDDIALSEARIAQVAAEHENAGRRYPRPTSKCDLCGGKLILCWGTQVSHHWRHAANLSKCIGGKQHAERLSHRLAKTMVAEFLNGGGTIRGFWKCPQCAAVGCTVLSRKTTGAATFELEIPHPGKEGDAILDVAGCLAKTDESPKPIPCCAVEIRASHLTTGQGAAAREDLVWIEVKADKVIDKLDTRSPPNEISLKDISPRTACGGKNCISMRDLAAALGYFVHEEAYSCLARQQIDEAIRGKFLTGNRWVSISQTSPSAQLREAFAKRQKCLRCEKCYKDVETWKPFCARCYGKTKREEDEEDDPDDDIMWEHVSEERKRKTRQAFSWLSDIPGGWTMDTPCCVCGLSFENATDDKYSRYFEPGSNFVRGFVWWFGDKKAICTICLEKERAEREYLPYQKALLPGRRRTEENRSAEGKPKIGTEGRANPENPTTRGNSVDDAAKQNTERQKMRLRKLLEKERGNY